MANFLHQDDLPDRLDLGPVVAIDTETMGLDPHRDRLCVVQLSAGDGDAHLVQVARGDAAAPNLARLLADPARLKLFHFGRFDIAVLMHRFGVLAAPVYCTKIASRLVRTYTDRHGLKELTRELLDVGRAPAAPDQRSIEKILETSASNRWSSLPIRASSQPSSAATSFAIVRATARPLSFV
jgi:DNA polymerase III epsilon subunit-like protein